MDPLYKRIMDFVNYYESITKENNRNYKYIRHVNFDEKPSTLRTDIKIIKYNFGIYCYFYWYIYFLKRCFSYYDKLKEYEPKFIELFYEIMTNNYKNIKYDFTQCLLARYEFKDAESILTYMTITKYKNIELIYLLERINPNKLSCLVNFEIAYFIYNKLSSYLRLAWIGAVIKGAAVFALMAHFIKYRPIFFSPFIIDFLFFIYKQIIMSDPSYRKIMDFVNYYESIINYTSPYYKIIKEINFVKIDEEKHIMKTKIILKYNYYIYRYFYLYIYFLNKRYSYYDKLKEYEPKFIELFYEIMTNNFKNIKYEFTHFIILSSFTIDRLLLSYINITKYNNIELIYLLERINPCKLPCFSSSDIAKFIFNKLTDLRLTWMWAVITSAAVFGLYTPP